MTQLRAKEEWVRYRNRSLKRTEIGQLPKVNNSGRDKGPRPVGWSHGIGLTPGGEQPLSTRQQHGSLKGLWSPTWIQTPALQVVSLKTSHFTPSHFLQNENHNVYLGCLWGWNGFALWQNLVLRSENVQRRAYLEVLSHSFHSPGPKLYGPLNIHNLGFNALADLVSFSTDRGQSSWGRHSGGPSCVTYSSLWISLVK